MREKEAMTTKRFPLRVLLTVTTGRLLTKSKGPRDNGIGSLYDLLGWMTDDAPFTHQLPRFGQECNPWLLRWWPELGEADKYLPNLDAAMQEKGNESAVEDWLSMVKVEIHGEDYYDVPHIPRDDHLHKNPIDELQEMAPKKKVVIIKIKE